MRHNIYIFPLILMSLFVAVIITFTIDRQKRIRHRNLHNIQNYFAEITGNYILRHDLYPDSLHKLSALADLLPGSTNLGIWTLDSRLVYDNQVDVHKSRMSGLNLPEIEEAILNGIGSSIRRSNFMDEEYAYYAKKYDDYIIRIAFSYETAQERLRPDSFYAIMILFISISFAAVFSIYHFRFRAATSNLKKFLSTYIKDRKFPPHSNFIDSELDEIERMFADICNQLEANEKRMSEMTNNVAHEIRTPVTIIRGMLETIRDYKELPIDKKYEYIERAYKQTIRLSRIAQDTILLSKTSSAPYYFSLTDVEIRDIVLEIYDDIIEVIKLRKAIVEINIEKGTVVHGSRTLLYAIFRNLLSNAVKYTGDDPKITIQVYGQTEDYYEFNVFDNGTGVDPKHIDHIFDRFYRINEGRTRDKGGSGLGLAIVRDAVKFHHGEITARNRPGGGLEFFFTIKKKITEPQSKYDSRQSNND
ncbi:MAG: HAMP domain-containing histidine kinase [Dysgonamonadaceae bacterium]|nr:HAMP domain-containing histidine kinase [Dysgonamonadaceae bacterium]